MLADGSRIGASKRPLARSSSKDLKRRAMAEATRQAEIERIKRQLRLYNVMVRTSVASSLRRPSSKLSK